MAQKPIDKITIRDITDLCDMRRQNFYYHFQDIYDLMHWMFQQEAVSLLEKYEGAFCVRKGSLKCFGICRQIVPSAYARCIPSATRI